MVPGPAYIGTKPFSFAEVAGIESPAKAPDEVNWGQAAKPSGVQDKTLVSVPVQDEGRVHVEEAQVSRLLPEPPDTPVYSDACHQDVQEGTLFSVPVQERG